MDVNVPYLIALSSVVVFYLVLLAIGVRQDQSGKRNMKSGG